MEFISEDFQEALPGFAEEFNGFTIELGLNVRFSRHVAGSFFFVAVRARKARVGLINRCEVKHPRLAEWLP